MKKIFFIITLNLCSLIHSVQWQGTITDTLIQDQDIEIKGDCVLSAGSTVVWARYQDVKIIVNKGSKISSDPNTPATLVLRTSPARKITIDVKNSITFAGVENQLAIPLIILIEGDVIWPGAGIVEWNIEKEKIITFGSSETQGGTHLKIALYEIGGNIIAPQNVFNSTSKYNGDNQVIFKRHSKMIYQYNGSVPTPFLNKPMRGLIFNCFEAERGRAFQSHNTSILCESNLMLSFIRQQFVP